MKRFLGFLLGLTSLNSVAFHLPARLEDRNINNVVEVEATLIDKTGKTYRDVTLEDFKRKQDEFSALVSKPVTPPPSPTSGASLITGEAAIDALVKYQTASPADTLAILNNSFKEDYDNVVVVESLLHHKCKLSCDQLNQKNLATKVQDLKNCLGGTKPAPKPTPPPVPTTTAEIGSTSAAIGPNMKILIEKEVIKADDQIKNGANNVSDADLAQYARMAKNGVPAGAVIQKMTVGGLTIVSGSTTTPISPTSTTTSKPVIPNNQGKEGSKSTDSTEKTSTSTGGGAGGKIGESAQELLDYIGDNLNPAERAILATKSDDELMKFMMPIRAPGKLKQSPENAAKALRAKNILGEQATTTPVSTPETEVDTPLLRRKIVDESDNDAIKQFMSSRQDLHEKLDLDEIKKLAQQKEFMMSLSRIINRAAQDKATYSTENIVKDLRDKVLPNITLKPTIATTDTGSKTAVTKKDTGSASKEAAKSATPKTFEDHLKILTDHGVSLTAEEITFLSGLSLDKMGKYTNKVNPGSNNQEYIKSLINKDRLDAAKKSAPGGATKPANSGAGGQDSPTATPTPKPGQKKASAKTAEPLAVAGAAYGPNVNALITAGVELTAPEAASLNDAALAKYVVMAKAGVPGAAVKQKMITDSVLGAAAKKDDGSAVGGSGGPTPKRVTTKTDGESGSETTAADPKLQKYRDMVRKRASNEEILAALMAPQPVNKETLEAVIPVDSTQDINDMAVLDYLLRTKYSQPQATLDKMYPYFKIIDIKRHLLPDSLKNITMEIPKAVDSYGLVDPKLANFPNTERSRNQKFARQWIEFPSSSMPRHLDYSNIGSSGDVWLLDSDRWLGTLQNDYKYITKYEDVDNYYWNPNGENFTLVYKNGKYQSYRGSDGSPVNDLVDLPKETEEIIVLEEPEEASPESSSASTSNKPNKQVKMPGETEPHFRARLRAKLDAKGQLGIGTSSTDILAAAIQGLDSTFIGLTDDNIDDLRKYAEETGKTDTSINDLLKFDPASTSLLDKAKIYIAIQSDFIKEDEGNRDDLAKWREALEQMILASVNATGGREGASGVTLNAGLRPNSDIFIQTISKFPGELTGTEIDVLGAPNKYIRSLGTLLKENPATASTLTKAKLNYALLGQWINMNAPQNAAYLADIEKWKTTLGITD